MKRESHKEREKHSLGVFKSLYKDFPDGEIIADENQERPDVLVKTARGNLGIEITHLHSEALKRDESEADKVIEEALAIYELKQLPKVCVSVHFFSGKPLSRKNRTVFASAIAQLVATNMPSQNDSVAVDQDWSSAKNFPFEISAIDIYRYSASTRNAWHAASSGFIIENFTNELDQVISSKETLLTGYGHSCVEQWLLIVAENISPSTFFEPSHSTLGQTYASSFKKVFLLNLFSRKLFGLKISCSPR